MITYSNSPLATYAYLLPYNSGARAHSIDTITPHCWEGHGTLLSFQSTALSRQISANYAIDDNGKIGLFVEESKRSWCSSSGTNDNRAVTIECASDASGECRMYDAVYESLVRLCADICKRNGKTKLIWFGSKDATLSYTPAETEMVLTAHRWFNTNKSCPGNWLYGRYGDLAAKVNAILSGSAVGFTASTDGKTDTTVGIESVNDGKDYLVDEDAAAVYGLIWHTETFEGVTDPADLKAVGEEWLRKQRGIRNTVEISAVDLHVLDGSIAGIRVGRKYPVRISQAAEPLSYECKKATIDLLDPSVSRFTFGSVRNTLTGRIGNLRGTGKTTIVSAAVASDANAQIRRLDAMLSADIGDVSDLITALTARVEALEKSENEGEEQS